MTDTVEECREKFGKVLATISPQKVVSDDTFLEKIQSYLLSDGMFVLLSDYAFYFIIFLINFLSSPQSTTIC
jgi:hypothetical protein